MTTSIPPSERPPSERPFDALRFEPGDDRQPAGLRFVGAPIARPLVTRAAAEAPPRPERPCPEGRSKIWEFNSNLHCSIIGTCLSTAELRRILARLGLAEDSPSDHDLHARAVALASEHNKAAKLLHKALDQQHRLAINRFAKAATEPELRALWHDAVRRGDIPAAYWATLTHPAVTASLIKEAFGDVHMLSHMVGAANRADIRRLAALEADKAALEARLHRQQVQLRDAVVSRDAQIQQLQQALAQRIVTEQATTSEDRATEAATLHRLVAELDRRLGAETRRRTTLERRLAVAEDALARERQCRQAAECDNRALRAEAAVVEANFPSVPAATGRPVEPSVALDGMALLYVGGRPNQVTHLRALGENLGADFLHHDGGIEDQLDLLPGLASRADLVLFPVDCVSHDAVLTVKRLCRHAGKRYLPLRSAGVSSFLAALDRLPAKRG